MDTHNAFVRFGKYTGERVTRIPVGYLKWAIANKCEGPVELSNGAPAQLHEVAPFEIKRRGERIDSIDVSMHAIDRASLYFLPKFRLEHGHMEGLASWLQRTALEAWTNRWTLPGVQHEGDNWKIPLNGVIYVIEKMVIPVVKTVESV